MPSIVTATVEPDALPLRSSRNASDGLRTSRRPDVGHLEDADLIGRAEPVLHRPQDPVLVKAITFQIEHGVDHVLQHAGPGDRPFFGDMADDQDRDVARLRPLHQPGGAFPHLRDTARRRGDLVHENGLDRVDDQQPGRMLVGRRQYLDQDSSRTSTQRSSGATPRRSARSWICCADSSAET